MKRTPRPQTLPGVYRFVAAALAVLWGLPLLAFWGYASAVPSAPPATTSFPYAQALSVAQVVKNEATATEEHRKVCSCANCPGGSHCCCSTASSPADSLVIRAVCDQDTPLVVSIAPGKIAFLATTALVNLPITTLVQHTYATSNDTAPSHSPAPFQLPPRLS